MIKSKKLGEILVEGGLLTLKQLDQALPFQKKSKLKLGQFLVREGIISEVQIVDLLSNQLKIEKYLPDKHILDMGLVQIIPADIAHKYSVAPLQKNGMLITVAMTDPLDINALDAIEGLTNLEAEAVICTEQQLKQLHTVLYGTDVGIGGALEDLEDVQIDKQVEKSANPAEMGVGSLQGTENEAPEDLQLDLEVMLEAKGEGKPGSPQTGKAPDLVIPENIETKKGDDSEASSKAYDKVYFSVYHPREVLPGNHYGIVFYAHIERALKEIEQDIKKIFEELVGKTDAPKRSKLSAMIKEGTTITVVAECDELDFNPATSSKRWEGPFARFLFDLAVPKSLRAGTLFMRFSVQILGIEIAQVKFAIEVTEKSQIRLGVNDYSSKQGELYKKIFLSYSPKDREAVDAYRSVFQSFSGDIFIDSNSIDWLGERNQALPKVVEESDVFYLFWSQNASASPGVRQDFETAIQHRCLGNYAAKPCRSFVRMVHWDQPMQPEPWVELQDFKPIFLPQLKGGRSGAPASDFSTTRLGAAESIENHVRGSFEAVAGEFQKALGYAETDPSGSLNKTRIVLEAMLLDIYRREMGGDPKEKHIGVLLRDSQFTRKIDRMILCRIKTLIVLGDLGSRGEPLDAKDARYGLEDLFAVIDWHRRTYHARAQDRTTPALP